MKRFILFLVFACLFSLNVKAGIYHGIDIDNPEYDLHQAEVMVREYVPLNYIMNIENPEAF